MLDSVLAQMKQGEVGYRPLGRLLVFGDATAAPERVVLWTVVTPGPKDTWAAYSFYGERLHQRLNALLQERGYPAKIGLGMQRPQLNPRSPEPANIAANIQPSYTGLTGAPAPRLRTDPQHDVERQVRVLCLDPRPQLLGCRGARKLLQEVVAFSDPLRFKPTHSDSLHSNSFTRRATRAVVGADCEKADGIYLKRPPPAQAPCPRANPGLHLATLQASGRVALAPRRCAVTRA